MDPPADRMHTKLAEADVLKHRALVHQAEVLVDEGEPVATQLGWPHRIGERCPVDLYEASAVSGMHAGEDLDERRLP